MKTIMFTAMAAAALALAGAPKVAAQDASPQDAGVAAPDADAGPARGTQPGDRMAEHLTKALGLSAEQATKLKVAFKERRESALLGRDRVEVARAALQERVDSKAPDSEIKAALEKLDAEHRAMRADQEKFNKSLDAILTPTQRARLTLSFMRHLRRRGMRGERGTCDNRGNWGGRGDRSASDAP